MNRKNLLTLTAVFGGIFSLGWMFLPSQLFSIYGTTTDETGTFLARFFGGSIIGYVLAAWSVRDASAEAQNPVILALFVSYAAGFVLSLVGQFSGIIQTLGWVIVVVFGLFTLGFGYYQFKK